MLEFLFNKAAELQTQNFVKKELQCRFLPVIIVQFLRKSILKNICERLLLTHTFFGILAQMKLRKKTKAF